MRLRHSVETAADTPDAGGSASQTAILRSKSAKSAQQLFPQPTPSKCKPFL